MHAVLKVFGIMLKRAIEIHDSVLERIEQSPGKVALHFSSVYIHQSEGVPGRDAGTGWVQRAILRIVNPRISGGFSEFPVCLSDGRILLGEISTVNEIPIPLVHVGRIELSLEAYRKTKEEVTFEGTSAEMELIGEPEYVEQFRP